MLFGNLGLSTRLRMTSATANCPSTGSPRASKYIASAKQAHCFPPVGFANLRSQRAEYRRLESVGRDSGRGEVKTATRLREIADTIAFSSRRASFNSTDGDAIDRSLAVAGCRAKTNKASPKQIDMTRVRNASNLIDTTPNNSGCFTQI